MQLEEVKTMLTDLQNSTFEGRILNILFNFYQEQNSIKEALVELQNRLNDTIIEVNALLIKEEQKEEKNNEL